MAKATSKNKNADADDQNLSYGEALARLEAIVEAMEEEDLPLEQLLTRYEEGRRLADLCQARLAQAELRIQQLERTAEGELTLSPPPEADGPEKESDG
jgi:exodeoxyribonuclease VII small subunit